MNLKITVCIFFLHIAFGSVAAGETLNLSVAASMTDAFKEILNDFSGDRPAARMRPNYASSGSLAKQIEQGAPADIYVSANPKWMEYLAEKEMIAPGTEYVFAYNKLVFIGYKATAVNALTDLVALDRIALGSPQSVPAGQYARQAMERAGIYHELTRQRKLVMAKDVRQALIYADRGEVDGAFVYSTDAMLAAQAEVLFTVPDDLYDRVAYPLALTMSGADNDLAKAFYAYMKTTRVVDILRKHGFEPRR